jgi:hypothetical protein
MHQDLLQAENGSAIVNAEIGDGVIVAGLIVATPLSKSRMLFGGYEIEMPEELIGQGVVCSLTDIELNYIRIRDP